MSPLRTCSVSSHVRARPYSRVKAAKTAQLMAEVEARVDAIVTAAFRTFHINAPKQIARGR